MSASAQMTSPEPLGSTMQRSRHSAYSAASRATPSGIKPQLVGDRTREHTMRAAFASLRLGFASRSINKSLLRVTAPWLRSLPAHGKKLTISTLLLSLMAADPKAALASDCSTTRIFTQRMCVIRMATNWPPFVAALQNRSDLNFPSQVIPNPLAEDRLGRYRELTA